MSLTPLDVQQQQFRVRFRGFDVREVDRFLEQVAEGLAGLQNESKNLKEEVRRLKLET
jgi:cell division initiation protein